MKHFLAIQLLLALFFSACGSPAGMVTAAGGLPPEVQAEVLSPRPDQVVELRCPYVEIAWTRGFDADLPLQICLNGDPIRLHEWTRTKSGLYGHLEHLPNGTHQIEVLQGDDLHRVSSRRFKVVAARSPAQR